MAFQQQIDYLTVNFEDDRVAVYSQREDLITILHMDQLQGEKYLVTKDTKNVEIYRVNAKLDNISFYLKEYLVVATKDQSIKVVAYGELERYDDKKINRKKQIREITITGGVHANSVKDRQKGKEQEKQEFPRQPRQPMKDEQRPVLLKDAKA